MISISVIINTYNEEYNIKNAILSVKSWVDEIIVVDMYSTDRTVEIARSCGARIYMYENIGYADPARQFAIDQSSGEWILMLDADEMVPIQLSRLLRKIVIDNKYDVVNIPWINYLFGNHISYAGWGPHQDKHMRFFRRGSLYSGAEIHNFLQPVDMARILEMSYEPGFGVVHFNYRDMDQFINKMNRYTSIESKRINANSSFFWIRLFIHPPFEFFKRYILRGGFRDGRDGLSLSFLMFIYRLLSYLKAFYSQSHSASNDVDIEYSRIAKSITREYEKHK